MECKKVELSFEVGGKAKAVPVFQERNDSVSCSDVMPINYGYRGFEKVWK